jgi:hypothetical protein
VVSATPASDLERAVQRYGDDIYRLAILLLGDERQAARALIQAVRRMALDGTPPDEPALIRALLAALPKEAARPPRRLPGWAAPSPAHPEAAPLLAAIVRLPRPLRLVLGLAIGRAFEPRQLAAIVGGDEASAREQLRDALLLLAPHAPIERASLLTETDPPADCRPTRAALALADPARMADPSVRGHLALCSLCRAADLAWSQLSASVEEILRGALRELRLPAQLLGDMQAAARAPGGEAASWLAQPRTRIALVTVPVLLLIAFLVWPRGAPTPTGSSADLAAAADPRTLVQRATAQLYAPPPDQAGVWHAQYAIQWFFADGAAVLLNADQWRDPAGGRHRLQLVHHSGGGPYEFELSDGTQSLWYAVSESYVNSLYPFGAHGPNLRVRFPANERQRAEMLQARLGSGPWAVPRAYLRQAASAELRTWGRQRDADGRLLQLVSFAGISPLALPPDAPEATTSKVTVLLTIDEASGQLREVRELFGESGAEQSARSTWRLVSEETITDTPAANRAFDQATAWNGIGTFATVPQLRSPLLPLLDWPQLVSPAWLVQQGARDILMPAQAPPGTSAAVLVNAGAPPGPQDGYLLGILSFGYIGPERQLFLHTVLAGDQDFALSRADQLAVNGMTVRLQAMPAQGYRALILHPGSLPERPLTTSVLAQGYTRAELLDMIRSLAPPSLAALRAQAALFVEQQPHDAAWQALLGALADPPQPPDGGARHFTEQVFKRQSEQPDPFADPYHAPPYGGWPATFVQENWARRTADGDLAVTITRSTDGRELGRQWRDPANSWDYDTVLGSLTSYPSWPPLLRLNEDQSLVLRMLTCPGAIQRDTSNGANTVMLIESSWRGPTCAKGDAYAKLWDWQTNTPEHAGDQAPYLADLLENTLTTVITLNGDGRPARTEIWSGIPGNGALLESWERINEELVQADRVPAQTFSAQPPAALVRRSYGQPSSSFARAMRGAGLEEVLQFASSPVLGFTPGSGNPEFHAFEIPNASPTADLPFTSGTNVFENIALGGYAFLSTYTITSTDGTQMLRFYQGPAREMAANLKVQGIWNSSVAQPITIGDQTVQAWDVIDMGAERHWLLFEYKGTLVAAQDADIRMWPVLSRLQVLNTPNALTR